MARATHNGAMKGACSVDFANVFSYLEKMPLPPRRPPVVSIPRPRPNPVPAPSVPSTKVANRRAVARLRKQYTRIQRESYDMGATLNALKQTEVVAQYGETNFKTFVEKHVMPYSNAYRCMVAAEHFTKATATKLGLRKAQLLHSYLVLSKHRQSAEKMAKADRKVGSPRRAISTLSTRDLETLIKQVRMQDGKSKIPKPTPQIRRTVAKMKAKFVAEFGVVPTVRIDMKRGVVELEIPLSEAGRVVGDEE